MSNAPSNNASANGAPVDLATELTRGFAARLIRKKAKQLIRRPEFSKSDRQDIEQELRLELLAKAERFRPDVRHWNVFVTTIVERYVAEFLKQVQASKRDGQVEVSSLSEVVMTPEGVEDEIAQLILPEDQARMRQLVVRHYVDEVDRRIDVEELIASLPRRYRKLARQLQRYSVKELARRTRTPERTLRNRISRMRQYLAERSAEKHWPKNGENR